MPAAIRVTDKDTINRTVTGSAGKTYIVGFLAARAGDAISDGGSISSGSSKVFIEGQPAARAGDPDSGPLGPATLVASQTKVVIGP